MTRSPRELFNRFFLNGISPRSSSGVVGVKTFIHISHILTSMIPRDGLYNIIDGREGVVG